MLRAFPSMYNGTRLEYMLFQTNRIFVGMVGNFLCYLTTYVFTFEQINQDRGE